jgi:hypothetical protein
LDKIIIKIEMIISRPLSKKAVAITVVKNYFQFINVLLLVQALLAITAVEYERFIFIFHKNKTKIISHFFPLLSSFICEAPLILMRKSI